MTGHKRSHTWQLSAAGLMGVRAATEDCIVDIVDK